MHPRTPCSVRPRPQTPTPTFSSPQVVIDFAHAYSDTDHSFNTTANTVYSKRCNAFQVPEQQGYGCPQRSCRAGCPCAGAHSLFVMIGIAMSACMWSVRPRSTSKHLLLHDVQLRYMTGPCYVEQKSYVWVYLTARAGFSSMRSQVQQQPGQEASAGFWSCSSHFCSCSCDSRSCHKSSADVSD